MNLTIYPGMDASYHIGQQWKVFVSYNSSLRLPSFTEMYYKLQGYAANPHLKPEKMRAIEIGTQYTSPTLQAKFTAYHHHGKDMIDWIMDTRQGNEAQWQSVNHTRLNTYGMEINARLATRLGSVAVAYSYICQDKELEAGIVSQYALEYLRHQLVATVQTKPWRGWSLRIDGRYQDRVGQYTNFNDEVCNYRPYALFDGRIQWQTNHYTLFTQVNNMFDNTTYVDYGNVPQPGAWFTAGLHYTF
jgi:iron complex outermembrane receptor protein